MRYPTPTVPACCPDQPGCTCPLPPPTVACVWCGAPPAEPCTCDADHDAYVEAGGDNYGAGPNYSATR